MANENPILNFVAAGYRIKDTKPFNGAIVQVITNQLNIYNCRYDTIIGFETPQDFKDDENVFAWKYLTEKH